MNGAEEFERALAETRMEYREALDRLADETKNCEECGKPEGSFACKIRHQHIDLRWTKGIH